MSIGITKLFEDAESYADAGRYTLAIQSYEEARRLTKIPDRRAWATFNLGVVYWRCLGDGVAARHEFLSAASDFETYGYGKIPQAFRIMHANAVENAMLCALSFDEFEKLAANLHTLTPDMPILAGLVPLMREEKEQGKAWSDFLFFLASTYYNRNDSKLDHGGYGQAKSTYHLLLANRRKLRLKKTYWQSVIYEYCALAQRMTADCWMTRGGDADRNPPEEFLSILTGALPFVDEYLAIHSGDDTIKKIRADMDTMINNNRMNWNKVSPPDSIFYDSLPNSTEHFRCPQCHQLITNPIQPCPSCGNPSEIVMKSFTASIFGAFLGGGGMYYLLSNGAFWLSVLGLIFGVIIGFCLFGAWAFRFYLRRFGASFDSFD